MINLDRLLSRAFPLAGVLAVSISASLSWSTWWLPRVIGYACMLLMVYLTSRMLSLITQRMEKANKLLDEAKNTRLDIVERITAQQARNNGLLERARKEGLS